MTDEERKAFEDLKDMIEKAKDLMEEEFYKLATIHNIQAVETLLNLIEKQQKEIEELKEDNKRVKFLYDDACKCLLNSVDKDKIKAKIEEYEKQQKEEPDAYLCIKVLQSVLEKE